MDEEDVKPPKIILPKEPQVIGQHEGKPVFVEPQDLIPTQEEQGQIVQNTEDHKFHAAVDQIANKVLDNAVNFYEETLWNVADSAGKRILQDQDPIEFLQWSKEQDYTFIQRGLTTVVKKGGKVLREMTAKIDPRFQGAVDKRIRIITKC